MSNGEISPNLRRIIIDKIIDELGKSYCEVAGDLSTGYTTLKKLRLIAACLEMSDSLKYSTYKTMVYQYIASKYDLSVRYVQTLPEKHPQYFKKYDCVEFIPKGHNMFKMFENHMDKNYSSINYDLCLDYTDIKIVNRMYACLIIKEHKGQPIDKQLVDYIKSETTLGTSSIKHLKTSYPQHFMESRCF
jgi:hypothetical protein